MQQADDRAIGIGRLGSIHWRTGTKRSNLPSSTLAFPASCFDDGKTESKLRPPGGNKFVLFQFYFASGSWISLNLWAFLSSVAIVVTDELTN